MADPIYLVQGDNRPYITLTLVDQNGAAIDLSPAGVSASLHMVPSGGGTVATFALSKVETGADGRVRFNFPGSALSIEPGWYSGEVEVLFDGDRQTVYEKLSFFVRADIA